MLLVTIAIKTIVKMMQDLNTIVMDQVKMDYTHFVIQSIMLKNASEK